MTRDQCRPLVDDAYLDRTIRRRFSLFSDNFQLIDEVDELDKEVNGPLGKVFIMRDTQIEHGWSRSVLIHQIESQLWQREGKALTNFSNTFRGRLHSYEFLNCAGTA